ANSGGRAGALGGDDVVDAVAVDIGGSHAHPGVELDGRDRGSRLERVVHIEVGEGEAREPAEDADMGGFAGAGEPAHVRVFSGLTRFTLADFYVNDPLEPGTAVPSIQFDAGVRVAAADVNGDGIDDVITAKGPGSTPTVR